MSNHLAPCARFTNVDDRVGLWLASVPGSRAILRDGTYTTDLLDADQAATEMHRRDSCGQRTTWDDAVCYADMPAGSVPLNGINMSPSEVIAAQRRGQDG
jgi:hypothetical protein